MKFHRQATLALLFACGVARAAIGQVDEYVVPDRIRLLPVCLVPRGERPPTRAQQAKFMRHIDWSRQRFHDMLDRRDTFDLAKKTLDVVRLQKPIAFYKSLENGKPACHWVAELLDHYKVSRFKCSYTFCLLVMNSAEDWPIGGGRTINGGINRGGGMLQISSFALDRIPGVQSTLQHEIGHSCGLPHVDVYGYDMKANESIMSYNDIHKTNGFQSAKTPGELIPEDLRGLALNSAVFPELKFNPRSDLPDGYKLFPRVVTLGPMDLPGQPPFDPVLTTPSGEDNNSKLMNITKEILASEGPGVTFRNSHMWASKQQPDGKVIVEIAFPGDVRLTRVLVHSEHSGQYNRAEAIQIEVEQNGNYKQVASQPLESADAVVEFPETTAREWRLVLQAGRTGKVCLRGLQYFSGKQQLFPPRVPYQWQARLEM